MKRYRFALEGVLRVRRIEQDHARLAVADAMRQVAVASAALDERLDHYDDLPAAAGAQTVGQFMADRLRRDLAAASVVQAGVARLVAVAVEDERRTFLHEAHTRVAALERLDDRRRDEHAVEAGREEAKIVDDIVTGRYARAGAR